MVVNIQHFSVLPCDIFPPGKYRLNYAATSVHVALFVELEYLGIYNQQTGLELVEQFSRKLTMCFPLRMEKLEKEIKVWENNKLVLSSARWIEVPLEFCDYI